MGKQPGDLSFTVGHGWHVKRKTGYLLAFLAVASCVVVGLLTYYIGVDGKCGDSSSKADKPAPSKKPKVTDVRLPVHLKPDLYVVKLIPFVIPDNFTIKGHAEITMECKVGGTDNVTLHIADIDLDTDSVRVFDDNSGKKLGVLKHSFDKDREFYIAKLNTKLIEGNNYTIKMDFVAKLGDNLKGFYRSSYTDTNTGKKEYIGVTQFQPTDARRAFPCFDEPGIKASYKVSLGRKKDMKTISNMPISEDGEGVPMPEDDEYVWDHYDTSVPMSTYLVAFVVSKFGYETSPPSGNGVEFRIWSRKDALDQIAYAKDLGPKILKFFEGYFNVSYPLPKQDMIAIPDFSAGAMENWGLITYRETALLFKEGVSAASNKQRIAVVVSHELAHQWFGNLVTPSWWTDLWLNEGFASYVEYLGVEATQPDMKLLEQFVYSDLQNVFGIDALESSHPISIPVKHPDEINEIFDRISYAKGASIIRMMDKFLTTNTFRGGLTNYLRDFKYKAAEQDDLWEHLTRVGHKDGTLRSDITVKQIMDTWTLQMGFPVVTVNRNYDSNSAELTQERFLLLKSEDSKDTHDYRWWIPITHTTPNGNWENTYNEIWMDKSEKRKKINDMPDRNTPVIFNVQETGYYRVNYDKKNWQMLIKQLEDDHLSIHVINRAQIIDDALNLARAGLLDYQLALGVTKYLSNEREYIPWAAAMNGLNYLDSMLERSEAYGEFKKYMTDLIRPLYTRIGFEEKRDDKHLDIFLRRVAVNWACRLSMSECTDKVRDQYKEWMDQLSPDSIEGNPVNVNMKSTVYCHAIANGDESEWNFAWERYVNSNVASERRNLLTSMACTKEIWLLNRYLNRSLHSESGVRKQDGATVISYISSNIFGRDLAFDFVQDNWKTVTDYYGKSSFSFAGLIKNIMSNRNTKFELDEIQKFHDKYESELASATRAAKQAIEKAKANYNWMKSNYQTVFDWLLKVNRN